MAVADHGILEHQGLGGDKMDHQLKLEEEEAFLLIGGWQEVEAVMTILECLAGQVVHITLVVVVPLPWKQVAAGSVEID